jgi:pyrroline-5-carboxylate reductase
MKNTTLAFIGCGNMARSLIGGLVADGWDPASIHVADADPDQLDRISRTFPVSTHSQNNAAAALADVVVLAIKPQITAVVARELAETIRRQLCAACPTHRPWSRAAQLHSMRIPL